MTNSINVRLIRLTDNNGLYTGVREEETREFLSGESSNSGVNQFNITIPEPTLTSIKDKSFYRYPKLTLPRMKVDLLKEKANITITRNKDTADYKIISERYLNSLSDYTWSKLYTTESILEELNNNSNNFTNDCINEFKSLLNAYPDDYWDIKQGWHYSNVYRLTDNLQCAYHNYKYIKASDVSTFNEILNSNNLLLDTQLNSIIYEDMHVLTKEEYLNARNMIKSDDKENTALALELLSNCNLNESFDYVALLFYFYHDHLKEARNWNSINVKTLRNTMSDFVANSNASYGYYYNNFLQKLIHHDKLTEFAFKEVARYAFHNVVKRSLGLSDESVFTVNLDAIKINPKYKDKIKSNQDFFMTDLEQAVAKF